MSGARSSGSTWRSSKELSDAVGPDVLVWVDDGMVAWLDDQTLYLGDMAMAKGTPLMPDLVQAAMTEALAMACTSCTRATSPAGRC